MADAREVVTNTSDAYLFKVLPTEPPTPPSWYAGTPLFDYGANPSFAENLADVPLSHFFSSPFTEGDAKDSSFSRTVVSRDVRGEVGTRDWSDLKANPPTDFFKRLLIHPSPVGDVRLMRFDLGFCVWQVYTQLNLGSDNHYLPHLLQLDVPSGGKILTKQDFKLRVRPWWYSSNWGNMFPCFGGFSLHEVYDTALSDLDSYEKVSKRVIVIWADINPNHQQPFINDQGINYILTTDPDKQPEITGLGNYWLNFCDSSSAYGGSSPLKKIVHYTNGGWRQALLFVGEFSLKQLHDYITDTDKFAKIASPASYASGEDIVSKHLTPLSYYKFTSGGTIASTPYSISFTKNIVPIGGGETVRHDVDAYDRNGWLYPWMQVQLPKIDPTYSKDPKATKRVDLIACLDNPIGANSSQKNSNGFYYEKGSFYTQVKGLNPPRLVIGGKALRSPPPSEIGIYTYEFFGTVKIEAHTFDGAVPTPYKPVHLIERDTGRLIRSTISDKDGKYVLHGVPDGIDYVAVSIDPTKTFASTVEDFGVVSE